MQAISNSRSLPLHGAAATRRIEQAAAAGLPPHTLMQRAGLAAARLSLALAPHAQHFWIACGPGNNGGDGLEAAIHLHEWGKTVTVTWMGTQNQAKVPADALASLVRARAAGVPFARTPPAQYDFAIDALLGIGAAPRPSPDDAPAKSSPLGEWLTLLRGSSQPVLALDVPSALDADTGTDFAPEFIAAGTRLERAGARFCLSFLTLKPGLFTAAGRDLAGRLWWDELGVGLPPDAAPDAWLLGQDRAVRPERQQAAHASHKGSFGDVAVLGGESAGGAHMVGAALLAGRAALHAGAGRVYVALLGEAGMTVDPQQPELMFRRPDALDPAGQVIVCGCGGGEAVARFLPKILSCAPAAVLDADALNALARDTQLQAQLRARQGRRQRTVLTPHPLEAARLLGTSTSDVQANRRPAAEQLASQSGCVVVLKGSGTVIAAPGQVSAINPTGNARLATAGTGDVLAGMLGALLAQDHTDFDAACSAVYWHGHMADKWATLGAGQPLTASALASAFS